MHKVFLTLSLICFFACNTTTSKLSRQVEIEDVNGAWTLADRQSKTPVPKIDLYFNHPVSGKEVQQRLTISIEGKAVPYQVKDTSQNTQVTLTLQGIEAKDRDIAVTVLLAKGLSSIIDSIAPAADAEIAVSIPSPFNLVINDVEPRHNGISGSLFVRTSQPIEATDLAAQLSVVPAVKFAVNATDDGFNMVSSEFDAQKSYTITFKKGIRGVLGGILQEPYEKNIAFGDLEPSVQFTSNKSVFLSSKGNRSIDIRIVNVDRARIIISKIYESNLLSAQRYGYYPRETRTTEEYYDEYGDNELTMGDVIYEKEIDTRSLPRIGNTRLLKFDFEDKLADFKGIYHIKVRSSKDYWVSDSRFISVSDVGLIAREGRDKLFVFTNSIRSAEPLRDVNIVAYGNNNQVLGMGATNADGVAEIVYTRKEFAGFKPSMIVAKTADDFNYLPFNTTRVNTSRFETGGRRGNSTGLDAFIYGERDIYRPGERVNFSVIVRDRQWKTPGELPIIMKFLLPNGKDFKVFRKNLNEQGSLEGNVDIPAAAITGTYTLEVFTSTEVLLGSMNFSIEEFVPDRIRVKTVLDKTSSKPGEQLGLLLNAVNFFGPPAANRTYEVEIQVKAREFTPKKYTGYDFSLQNRGLSLDKSVREGRTDASGNARETYSVPELFANNGLLQANFYSTVFDETGRPVSRVSSAEIITQPVFFGIANDDMWYYPLNQPAEFRLIGLNAREEPLSVKARVRVIRKEYRTVLARSGSYFRYESQEEEKVLADQQITVNGENTKYSFVPRAPGNYEIRLSLPSATGYVSRRFYSYGAWGGDNSSFEVNTEGSIDIETDKSEYNAGDKVKALFKTPFNGKMLVTIESDAVLNYQYVEVNNRNASVDIPVKAEYLPNVYITATLIKPHGISDIPLTVAHGFQRVRISESKHINKVEITAVKQSRSKTKQDVIVKASPGSYVTLAAVDNGVLQVTDFKTPDPYGYFYADRALEVTAYDLYPFLFPEVRTRLSSTGGDGAEMEKRVNPMPSRRVKLVSHWSGIGKIPANGQLRFSIDIPEFSGQIRLMAVAYKENSFGSAESAITVADPLVLSAAVPRFLSPGDTVLVPLTVSNTTAGAASANVKLNVKGPLAVAGGNERTFTVEPQSEATTSFSIVAASVIDTGNIRFEVQSLGQRFTSETAIGVRPASPLLKYSGSGSIRGGATAAININTADFMPASSDYKLVISRNPALDLGEQLDYLLRYPYGCTEQIISAAFPQLYFDDLGQTLSGVKSSAAQNINEAIRKIRLRQLFNGAVTLWEGEGSEHWWSTVYAAHFLVEADKAGFEVDNELLNPMLNYINSRLRNRQTINYYYNRDQQKKIAPKEVAYSLYVLAIAAKANIPAMNFYKENSTLLSLDSKYLLSAAYALAGDKNKSKEILPAAFSGEVSVPETGGSFSSPIRDEAIALNALIDTDPANSQISEMARHVATQLKDRSWYSTQECAFSFLTLGKLAKAASRSTVTADIRSGGKSIGKFDGADRVLNKSNSIGTNMQIITQGEGSLYYYWQSEGISATGKYKEEDSYIRIRRQFYDRYGRLISGSTFRQNDLVIVQLTLERLYSGNIQNIVITDVLPAGFEIENARVREIPGMDWIKDAATPLATDIRDDRINVFDDLTSGRQVYYYAVRAVSPGKYVQGPVAADAMYNGEYHSYHGAGSISVLPGSAE